MAELTGKRDAAASKLHSKQATFDSSLGELEAKLTALLKRKIETTYAAKMQESAMLLQALHEETTAQDVDLEALRKMYAELVQRLEQQRQDHVLGPRGDASARVGGRPLSRMIPRRASRGSRSQRRQ